MPLILELSQRYRDVQLSVLLNTDEARARGVCDTLWTALKAKTQAHSGFLAEALVEAVPQAVLQTSAALLSGHLSALNLASILLSIGVIASKGWVVSYSLHRTTLAFNTLCVAADVLSLFAGVCWHSSTTAERLPAAMAPSGQAPRCDLPDYTQCSI